MLKIVDYTNFTSHLSIKHKYNILYWQWIKNAKNWNTYGFMNDICTKYKYIFDRFYTGLKLFNY